MKNTRALSKEKRNSIIEAAISEFERVGYVAASMDRISTDANVSKATVYNHFGSKKELFLALVMILKVIMDKYHYIDYDPKRSIEKQLRQFATQELELVCDPYNMTLMRIAINVMMNECEITSMIKEIAKDHIFENLAKWFDDAKADGKLQFDDTQFVTQQFVGNIKCFAFYPQLYGGAELLPKKMWSKVTDHAVKIVLTLYQK